MQEDNLELFIIGVRVLEKLYGTKIYAKGHGTVMVKELATGRERLYDSINIGGNNEKSDD